MAITTLYSNIDAAISLQERMDSTYLVIGKKTAWTDDDNPPAEVDTTTSLSEVIGYKKLKQLSLARPLAEGEDPETLRFPVVTYGGKSWALIPKEEAYAESARWLYMEAELYPDDLPLGPYRQKGIHVGVVPHEGITKQSLLPSEVSNPGILKFYENKEPQYRAASVYVLEQFVIKL